ncbi:MAG: alpha/beta fold hydrolase [Jatrophihabitantaceae bacterium]
MPQLSLARPKGEVRAVALVLHGGQENSTRPVRPGNMAALRMRPFAWSLHSAGRASGLAVARLRYDLRGWNGDLRSPVGDARTALAELTGRFPGVPFALVGHSMGGRTAIHVADDANVRAVVGLAPWIEPGEPVRTVTGRRVLIAHGDRDKITNPQSSEAWARAAADFAESISYVTVRGEQHAMLARASVWHRLCTGFVLGALFGSSLEGTEGADTANIVTKALAGEPLLVV